MARLIRIAPELPVREVRSALSYYRDKLGFEVATELPEQDYGIVERDGIAIHLFRSDAGHAGVHIFTDAIEELQAELLERGARVTDRITRRPWGNRDFRVHDDSGTELKFTEPLTDDKG